MLRLLAVAPPVLVALALVALVLVVPPSAERARLTLVAPQAAAVGEPVALQLVLRDPGPAVAAAADLRVDATRSELVGVRLGAAGLADGPQRALPTARTDAGVSLGVYSCAGEDCSGALPVAGDGVLAEVEVLRDEPGALALALDDVHLVDAAGRPVAVDVDGDAVVQVGEGGPVVAVPDAVDALDAVPVAEPTPLTTDADAARARLAGLEAAWVEAAERGAPGTSLGELQRAAATVASAVTPVADAAPGAPATFTVTSTGDGSDTTFSDGTCRAADGTCTLRAAVENANLAAGRNTIAFDIPGAGPHTIQLGSRLPSVTDTAGLVVDGYTQPGSAPNTDAVAFTGAIRVQVRGTGVEGDGFLVAAPDFTLRGLALYNFKRAVWFLNSDASRGTVTGAVVGTDVTGTATTRPVVRGASGVVVQTGATDITLGGPAPADRLVLSGSSHHGLVTNDPGTSRITLQGSIIGLGPDGVTPVPNGSHGVDINNWTTNTRIGGPGPGERNVLSGNGGEGAEISHGRGTRDNSVVGNLIGTTADGSSASAATGNHQNGVHVEGGPPVEGPNVVRGNVIVANGDAGVLVDRGAENTSVLENRIGLLADGTAAGNAGPGVFVASGPKVTLVRDNVIAHNTWGVRLWSGSVVGEPDDPPLRTTVTRNVIRDNGGPPIDIEPLGTRNTNDPGDADAGANGSLNHPEVTAITSASVTGTACAGCLVEASATGATDKDLVRHLGEATADAGGRFTVRLPGEAGTRLVLTATDPAGNTSETSLAATLPAADAGQQPPEASATASCAKLTCTLDARGSTDADGTVVAAEWDLGDGTTATGLTVEHTYAPGTYTATVTVFDDDGASSTASVQVTAADAAPTAQAAVSCTLLNCVLSGAGSGDPDGSITSYAWRLGDGSTFTGPAWTSTATPPAR